MANPDTDFLTKIDSFVVTGYYNISHGVLTPGSPVAKNCSGGVTGYSSSGTAESLRLSADITLSQPVQTTILLNGNSVFSGVSGTSIDIPLDPAIIANGQYNLNFTITVRGRVEPRDGTYNNTVTVSNIVLALTYTNISPEPIPEEVEVFVAAQEEDYICLFDEASDDYSTNGDIVLIPESATVKEEAGGSFDLEIKHPLIEPYVSHFKTGAIIRCPVPERMLPDIDSVHIEMWKVKSSVAQCKVYQNPSLQTTTTTTTVTKPDPPAAIQSGVHYTTGQKGTYNGHVWEVYHVPKDEDETKENYVDGASIGDGNYSRWWKDLGTVEKWQEDNATKSSESKTKPTPVVATMIANEVFTHISEVSPGWIRVRTRAGINGYVQTANCELYEAQSESVDAKAIRRQLFRIVKIGSDTKTLTATINAQHISYDFGNVILGKCDPTGMNGPSAIALIEASQVTEHDSRMILTDITDKRIEEVDWSWKNAINALLDPSDGAVPLLSAQLFRDNADFFLVKNNPEPSGYTLEFGKNLERLQWDDSIEELVTRIIPRAKDENDGDLMLPERYIDSPKIGDYAIPHVASMDIGWKVGEKRKVDGEEKTLTLEDVYNEMRTASQKQYTDYKVDEPDLDIKVNLVDVGNSVEYEYLKGFQKIRLYDQVTVICEPLGFTSTQQVVGYEFDAINLRYNSITLGDPFDTGRRNNVK